MKNTEIEYGCIGEWLEEGDWIMGNVFDMDEIQKPTSSFAKWWIVYNQNDIRRNSCTIVASYGALSDYIGKEFSNEYLKEATYEADALWFDENVGWWVKSAVSFVCKKEGYSYGRVRVGSEDYYLLMSAWWSMVTGYRGNLKYNVDRNEDSVVTLNSRGATVYGHSLRNVDGEVENECILPDNYTERESNVYRWKEIDKKIKESGSIFGWGYFIFSKFDIDMEKLPLHVHRDAVSTPARKQIVVAWESEASKFLNEWGELLYTYYEGGNSVDEADAIVRMLNDLSMIRSK